MTYTLDWPAGELRISDNFRLGELTVSSSHPHLVEPIPDELTPRAVRLIVTCLQPIRDHVGGRVRVSSGYRSRALNRVLGGSPTSQHTAAEAADITMADPRAVFEDLVAGRLVIQAGQVVYYPHQHFLHVALPSARFPTATWCVHWPARGMAYRPITHTAGLW